MEKDIYQVIASIDKYIKLNRVYLDKDIHGSGKFDFHSIYSNQYEKYCPYFVSYEPFIEKFKDIGIIFEPKTSYQSGSIKTSEGDYFLMSNYGAEDHFYNMFLNIGVYFVTGFISDKGHLIVATYSKNFEPKIYEEKFNPMKVEGKSPFILSNSLKNKRPFGFSAEPQCDDYKLILKIDSSISNSRNFKIFLNNNSNLMYENLSGDEYLSIDMTPKDDFKWAKMFKCIENLSTDYFNDTDVNILNRADMVAYLVRHSKRVEEELKILKNDEKENILSIFKNKEDFMNLIPQSIDLNFKSVYKQFSVEKGYEPDYGAEKLNQMFNFIKLQLLLKDNKSDNKKLKI